MLWDKVYGQQAAIEFLRGAIETGNLAHAYLFTGPAGVGKMLTAKVFASYLLYPVDSPQASAARERILREIHPDLLLLQPVGNVIRIDEVRELISELDLKPLEGSRKVALVDDADLLNQPASNAFLKTIEEPPAGSFLIFVTSRPDALLATVRSRLQPVRFRSLPADDIDRYLVEERGVSSEQARYLHNASGGVFGKMLLNLEHPDRLERWSRGVEKARHIHEMNAAAALQAGGEIQELVDEQVKALGGSQEQRMAEYAKALDTRSRKLFEKRAQERNKRELDREKRRFTFDILDGMASWFRDIIVWKLSDERPREEGLALMNEGIVPEMHEDVHHIYPEAALECMTIIQETRRALTANANPRLTLEDMMLRMREVASTEYNWPGV